MEEVVEGDFVERGRRGIGRDVAADARAFLVRPHHHRHRVPADDALDLPLQFAVAGVRGLLIGRDGVDVGRGGAGDEGHAAAKGLLLEPFQEELRPLAAPRPGRRSRATSSHSAVSCGIVVAGQCGEDAVGKFMTVARLRHGICSPARRMDFSYCSGGGKSGNGGVAAAGSTAVGWAERSEPPYEQT